MKHPFTMSISHIRQLTLEMIIQHDVVSTGYICFNEILQVCFNFSKTWPIFEIVSPAIQHQIEAE